MFMNYGGFVFSQEDLVVNHMAAKIIENVCSRESQYAQGFITAEVGPALWFLFTHSTVDALRVSAISVSIIILITLTGCSNTYCSVHFTFRELMTKISQCF